MRLGSGNMTQGSGPRRSGVTGRMIGSRGLRLKPVIEVITVSSSSDSDGEEDLEVLEENLTRLAARKTGRKYVETNKRVHSNKGRHQTQNVKRGRSRVNFTNLYTDSSSLETVQLELKNLLIKF